MLRDCPSQTLLRRTFAGAPACRAVLRWSLPTPEPCPAIANGGVYLNGFNVGRPAQPEPLEFNGDA